MCNFLLERYEDGPKRSVTGFISLKIKTNISPKIKPFRKPVICHIAAEIYFFISSRVTSQSASKEL